MKVNFSLHVDIFAKAKKDIELLRKDLMYEVESINMGQSSTGITLVIDKRKTYNSVDFDFFWEDEQSQMREINIYHSPLFNPYIGTGPQVRDLICFLILNTLEEDDYGLPF